MSHEAHYKPVGRLDGITSVAHDKAIQELLRGEADSIAIDLSELEFISSAGLRVLLLAAKATLAKGGKTVLSSPRPLVAEALKVSGFDAIVLIRNSHRRRARWARALAGPSLRPPGRGVSRWPKSCCCWHWMTRPAPW
jgi:anti-sigma B factor antagonist/stage II sporulation protein AA (anti-sigma F factor antagonist)